MTLRLPIIAIFVMGFLFLCAARDSFAATGFIKRLAELRCGGVITFFGDRARRTRAPKIGARPQAATPTIAATMTVAEGPVAAQSASSPQPTAVMIPDDPTTLVVDLLYAANINSRVLVRAIVAIETLTPEEIDFLRGVYAQYYANQKLSDADHKRFNLIYGKLVPSSSGSEGPLSISPSVIFQFPSLLEHYGLDDIKLLLGQPSEPWKIQSGVDGAWELTVDGDETRSLKWVPEKTEWKVLSDSKSETIRVVGKLADYFPVREGVPKKYEAQVRDSGLPFFEGGRLARWSSRGRSSGWLDDRRLGYVRFIAESGSEYFSLLPIDGADAFEAADVLRFIENHTAANGLIVRAVGIHFFQKEPRLLVEFLRRDKWVDKADQLSEGQRQLLEQILVGTVLQSARLGYLDADPHFEADYQFYQNIGDSVRLGLPVRARGFGRAVRRGNVFRLNESQLPVLDLAEALGPVGAVAPILVMAQWKSSHPNVAQKLEASSVGIDTVQANAQISNPHDRLAAFLKDFSDLHMTEEDRDDLSQNLSDAREVGHRPLSHPERKPTEDQGLDNLAPGIFTYTDAQLAEKLALLERPFRSGRRLTTEQAMHAIDAGYAGRSF